MSEEQLRTELQGMRQDLTNVTLNLQSYMAKDEERWKQHDLRAHDRWATVMEKLDGRACTNHGEKLVGMQKDIDKLMAFRTWCLLIVTGGIIMTIVSGAMSWLIARFK